MADGDCRRRLDLAAGQLTRYQLTNGVLAIVESGRTVTLILPSVEPLTVTIDQLRP